jgi:signal peptidase I
VSGPNATQQTTVLWRTWLIVVACSLLLGCSLFERRTAVFEGVSMLPTIKNGEILHTEKLDPKSKINLARGDIVVFKYPKDPAKRYIKRLIGMPGDTVEIREGEVWVSGSKLSEPYVASTMNVSHRSRPLVVVPQHSYYVLGDNRDNSNDSRAWGLVPEELLIAKVVDR